MYYWDLQGILRKNMFIFGMSGKATEHLFQRRQNWELSQQVSNISAAGAVTGIQSNPTSEYGAGEPGGCSG